MTNREKALALQAKASTWRTKHPDAWAWIVNEAKNDLAKHGTVSVQYLVEKLRYDATGLQLRLDAKQDDYKVSNAMAPLFARWLDTEQPELHGHIDLKRSYIDELSPYELAFKGERSAACDFWQTARGTISG